MARHQAPVGSSKNGRLKVQDGDSGKISWRSGKKGFVKDLDGDPISRVYANADMKVSHRVRMGSKSKANGRAPNTGGLPDDQEPGEEG